jgi:hypothetical protein
MVPVGLTRLRFRTPTLLRGLYCGGSGRSGWSGSGAWGLTLLSGDFERGRSGRSARPLGLTRGTGYRGVLNVTGFTDGVPAPTGFDLRPARMSVVAMPSRRHAVHSGRRQMATASDVRSGCAGVVPASVQATDSQSMNAAVAAFALGFRFDLRVRPLSPGGASDGRWPTVSGLATIRQPLSSAP